MADLLSSIIDITQETNMTQVHVNDETKGATLAAMIKAKGGDDVLKHLMGSQKSVTIKKPRKAAAEKKKMSTKQTPRSATDRNANCFTVRPGDGIVEGIRVDNGSKLAVFVGDQERGGKVRSIQIDRNSSPKLVEAGAHDRKKVFCADVGSIELKGKNPLRVLTEVSSETDSALVCIHTGRENVVKSRFFQQTIKLDDTNSHCVISGDIMSRKGRVASVEELWLLKEGALIAICFYDGSVKLLSYDGSGVTMSDGKEYSEKMFRAVCDKEEVTALTTTVGKNSDALRKRDCGYYRVIEAGIRTGFYAGAVDVVSAAVEKNDLRPKVKAHFLKHYRSREDVLPQLFSILCNEGRVGRRLSVKADEGADQEAINRVVRTHDGAYHKAIDIALDIGWWEGVAKLLVKARKDDDLRARVLTRFHEVCLDTEAKLRVGEHLHNAPNLENVTFLREREPSPPTSTPHTRRRGKKGLTRAERRARKESSQKQGKPKKKGKQQK